MVFFKMGEDGRLQSPSPLILMTEVLIDRHTKPGPTPQAVKPSLLP